MSNHHHVPNFLRRTTQGQSDKKGARLVSLHSAQIPESENEIIDTNPSYIKDQAGPSARHNMSGMQSSSSRSRTKVYPAPIPPAGQQRQTQQQQQYDPALYQHTPKASGSNYPAKSPALSQSASIGDARSDKTYRDGEGSGSNHGIYMGSSPEDGPGGNYMMDDGTTSPRSRSPAGSRYRNQPQQQPVDGSGRKRQPPSAMNRRGSESSGSFVKDSSGYSSVEEDRKRRTKADRNKTSPLAKRLGEEPPFMLSHPSRQNTTSDQYPGVILGSFAGEFGGPALGFGEHSVGFDGMEDILDFSQPRQRQDGRHDSATGLAPNIAPWLADDKANHERSSSAERSGANTPGVDYANGRDGHRNANEGGSTSSSSRSGSHPEIFLVGTPDQYQSASSSMHESQTRNVSSESVQTLSAYQQAGQQQRAQNEAFVAPGGGRNQRSRLASNATAASIDSGKSKRGFLGSFLKRKGTGVPIPPNDFNPVEGYQRGSMSGSASSKNGSVGSLSYKRSQSDLISPTSVRPRQQSYFVEEPAPDVQRDRMDPLVEDLFLDLNLDDMNGIVDHSLANALPQVPPTTSSVSSTQPSTTFSSLGLQGAPTSDSFGTTVSRGGSSAGSAGSSNAPHLGRQVIGEADRHGQQFSRTNPFSQSPTGSVDLRFGTPPSPQNLSPKGVHPHMGLGNQPRRPSHLRNVKLGSFDSEGSSDAPDALQPLAPAWAASGAGQTFFNDPFRTSTTLPRSTAESSPNSQNAGSSFPTPHATFEAAFNSNEPVSALDSRAQALAAADAAAWAAPESWGVEADEEEEEDAEDKAAQSSSSQEDEDWTVEDGTDGTDDETSRQVVDTKKPPPFGPRIMSREQFMNTKYEITVSNI